ncbi:MAG: hypothetical protein ACRC1P_02430 [Cellulosilyticaceae bacterium]
MLNITPLFLDNDQYKETLQITNTSDIPLTNITLLLDNLNITISQYKVTRERGSLTFTPPLKLIELGNLIPNETAEISFSLPDTFPSLLAFPLKHIQISYCTDSEECILSNLEDFLISTDSTNKKESE